MATNHTQNYALNLWEPADKFVREEFNENSNKIDPAIKAVDAKADTKASTAALNALTQTVDQKARVIVGYYTGDGQASRIINLGVRPKAVFLYPGRGDLYRAMSYGNEYYGGAAFDGLENSDSPLSVVSSGFRVYCNNSNPPKYYSNNFDSIYYYFAFC